jgi:hypothetical protein
MTKEMNKATHLEALKAPLKTNALIKHCAATPINDNRVNVPPTSAQH